jgi:hypothetical protein
MASASGHDELLRAAEAAGFAMAAPDDEQTAIATSVSSSSVTVEDLARGARAISSAPPAAASTGAVGALVPKSVRSGAHTVRETVYGYLGLGVPA